MDTERDTEIKEELNAEASAEDGATEKAASAESLADEKEISEASPIDYAELARADMRELSEIFPHLAGKRSIAELDNPLRYAALRDLGLSPKEAYLATADPASRYDNRSHLLSAVPKRMGTQEKIMSQNELERARELFSDLSDRELQRLYKKVTK